MEKKSLGDSRRFVVDCFELFADLAEPHRCVGEHLVLRNLLLDYISEDDLEGKAEAALFQVLLKHEGLVLSLARLLLRRRVTRVLQSRTHTHTVSIFRLDPSVSSSPMSPVPSQSHRSLTVRQTRISRVFSQP